MVKLVLLLGLAVVIAATAGVVTTWELWHLNTFAVICRQNPNVSWGPSFCALLPPLVGVSVSLLGFALLTTPLVRREDKGVKPT